VRWPVPGKNVVTWCKNLIIRSSSKKPANTEEVEGYDDPTREVAQTLLCFNNNTRWRCGRDMHGEWREVRQPATGAHNGTDGDSPRRGDGGLLIDAIGTLAFSKALGADNGMTRGMRHAQRPPTGRPGWKRQPLTGGPAPI
jgi:hypothetical protein